MAAKSKIDMNRIAVLLPLALAGLFVTTTTALPRAAAQTGAACDRACLTGIADTSFDTAAAHIFKVRNHKIHEIEAAGLSLPLNSRNGWSEFTR